ncbi:ureidoglycolate lyase [Escherichia coli]|nr:ureidoglycolate lyase [Escherichia coli]
MKLQVLPLSQEAFSAYGDVIETQQRDFFHINNGLVERYHDLALVEILEQDRTLISINRAQPANLPLTIYELERHPLGTQAFIPMKGEVFVVVVALGDDKPDLSTLRAFITNGEQGVNYHRNVWHHPLFVWQRVTDFLTIDRGGSDNCDVESIPEQELCFA